MLNIILIMKGILCLGAAVALLRSAAAFLPDSQDKRDFHDQLLFFQPAKGANKAAGTPAASLSHLETVKAAPRFGSNSPSPLQDTPSQYPGHSPSPDDDTTLLHPPQTQKPKFTIGSSASQWAITYTPYTSTFTCLSPSIIRSDIATIARKGFTSVRLYSIDCSALRHVGHAALTHGLKMIIGIQLDAGLADAETQLSDIIDWAAGNSNSNSNSKWDLIEMIVIGNEAIFNDQTTASALAAFISTSRTTLRSANYTGPVTTTEPISLLSQHRRALCPALDLTAANIRTYISELIFPIWY